MIAGANAPPPTTAWEDSTFACPYGGTDAIRRDIAINPDADRSERTPGWKVGVKPEK